MADWTRRSLVLIIVFAVLVPFGVTRQMRAQEATPAAGTPAAGTPLAGTPSAEGSAATGVTLVASGIPNPRAFNWNADGALIVSSAGIGGTGESPPNKTGSVLRIVNGCPVPVAAGFPARFDLGGRYALADVAFLNDSLYVLVDGSLDDRPDAPEPKGIYRVNPDGSWHAIANVGAWVQANPPKFVPGDAVPAGELYEMVSDGEAFYIAESNRGQIIRVTPDGAISRVVDLSENHPVPSGIAIAPGGGIYVGNLTAFPYSDGAAKVVKVTADGHVTDVWTGLTALTAIAVAPDGTLYALEMSTGNPTQPPFTRPNSGKVVRQTGPSSQQDVVTGLDLPVAMRFGPDGALYVGFPALSAEGKPGGILRVDVNATGNGVAAPSDPLAESQCSDLTAEKLAAAAPAMPSAAPAAPTAAGVPVTPTAAPGSVPGNSVAITIDVDVKTTGSGATTPGTAACPDTNAVPAATTVADQGATASGDVTIKIAVDVDTSVPCPANGAAPTTSVATSTATAALPMPTATPERAPSAATPVAAASTSTYGPGHPLAIAISNFVFDPAMATIPVGTTVTWTNNDQIAHTATSTTGVFSSGNLNKGQSYSYTFTKAGTYPYLCIYHPYMKGTIVVQ